MTRIKSLKTKGGYTHRIHRAKKNRRQTYDYDGYVLYKKKKEALKIKALLEE